MNDFFENVGKKITDTADVVGKTAGDVFDNVAKKTGEIVEEQKLKSRIRTMNKENQAAFLAMGKKLYEDFKDGSLSDIGFADTCREIETRDEQIRELRKQIAETKGLQMCSQCQAHLEPDAIYCPKCGAKVDDAVDAEEWEMEE